MGLKDRITLESLQHGYFKWLQFKTEILHVLEQCFLDYGSWANGSWNQFNGSQTALKWDRIEKEKKTCWCRVRFFRGSQTFVSDLSGSWCKRVTILDSRNKCFAALSSHSIVLIQSGQWLCKQFCWFHRMLWLWIGKPATILFRNVLCKHCCSQMILRIGSVGVFPLETSGMWRVVMPNKHPNVN